MERYGSYLGRYPWQILKNLSSPTVIFIDSHFPAPEASANTWYCRAMPFLSLYKSDCLSPGLQGDIGWFLWRCLSTSEETSSRLRRKMKKTEDTKRTKGQGHRSHWTSLHRTPGGCIPTWLHQLWLPQWHQWDSWAQVWTTSVSDTVTDPQLLIWCFSSFLVLTSNNFFSENGLWHFSFRFLLRLPLLLTQKNTKK